MMHQKIHYKPKLQMLLQNNIQQRHNSSNHGQSAFPRIFFLCLFFFLCVQGCLFHTVKTVVGDCKSPLETLKEGLANHDVVLQLPEGQTCLCIFSDVHGLEAQLGGASCQGCCYGVCHDHLIVRTPQRRNWPCTWQSLSPGTCGNGSAASG